jgi:hypothetical protein
MTDAKPNAKALQELILYYLRERVDHNNNNGIKYLVVTNIYEWFVIDEVWFENNVFRNSKLKTAYENWKLSGKDTKFFYDSIARSFLDEVEKPMPVTYFDVRTYEKHVANADKEDDTKLIGLYKILSPAHLLKQPFLNDSNVTHRATHYTSGNFFQFCGRSCSILFVVNRCMFSNTSLSQ